MQVMFMPPCTPPSSWFYCSTVFMLLSDAQYSSYYPQYHRPLHKLLGKPLFMELRLLNNSDTTVVLLVHYCVAYPRSGNAVWILLYNGYSAPHSFSCGK